MSKEWDGFGRWALPEAAAEGFKVKRHMLNLALAQLNYTDSVEGVRIWLDGKEVSAAVSKLELRADANNGFSVMRCTLDIAVRLVPPPQDDE